MPSAVKCDQKKAHAIFRRMAHTHWKAVDGDKYDTEYQQGQTTENILAAVAHHTPQMLQFGPQSVRTNNGIELRNGTVLLTAPESSPGGVRRTT